MLSHPRNNSTPPPSTERANCWHVSYCAPEATDNTATSVPELALVLRSLKAALPPSSLMSSSELDRLRLLRALMMWLSSLEKGLQRPSCLR